MNVIYIRRFGIMVYSPKEGYDTCMTCIGFLQLIATHGKEFIALNGGGLERKKFESLERERERFFLKKFY